jgi:hypothetical protein
MPIIQNAVRDAMRLLQKAAAAKKTVSYSEFGNLFDHVDAQGDRWDTLDEAAQRICDPHIANYGALMATKDTGLPGAAIFKFFRDVRRDEYAELTGGVPVEDLTKAQREKLVAAERNRVYANAAS